MLLTMADSPRTYQLIVIRDGVQTEHEVPPL